MFNNSAHTQIHDIGISCTRPPGRICTLAVICFSEQAAIEKRIKQEKKEKELTR